MFFFFCLSKTFLPQAAFHSRQFLSFLNSYHHHPKYIIQQIHQMIARGLGAQRDYISQTSMRLGHMIVFTTEMWMDVICPHPSPSSFLKGYCCPVLPATIYPRPPHIFFLWAETQVTFAAQLRPSRKRQMLGCSKGWFPESLLVS